MELTDKQLRNYLKEYFGFTEFRGKQEEAIKSVLAGKNTFVLMPTGGGKSLTFQLPALILPGTAIVISPLIALMKNQVDLMRSYSTVENVAHFLNSSLTKKEITQIKKYVLEGKTKLLYVAPEFFAKEDNIMFLKQVDISFYAIDEAHCISEWGHDFRPDYRNIRPNINKIKVRPIIALTATATPKVQADILKNLGIQDATIVKSSFYRPNLFYEVRPKINPDKQIISYIKQNPGKSGIIYCLRRNTVENLAKLLQTNGIKALPYHAGLDAAVRTEHQDKFLNEEVDVIVATIAFGMGIDKPDIRFVIHYDMPKSLEAYYQETGRAGRDGGEGVCIAFYSQKDIQKLENFLQKKSISEQEIGKQLIAETVAYAEAPVCRARAILHYFGEELKEDCGNCDNCKNPPPEFDGTNYAINVLKLIKEIKERFDTEHIAKILAGELDETIRTYKHEKLKFFGIEKGKDKRFWRSVIYQILLLGLLKKDIEKYGVLKITEKGKKFLKEPYIINLREPHDFTKEKSVDENNEMANFSVVTADQKLFNMLKSLRKKMSKEKKVPPFVIFQDTSLTEMAINYPITEEELKQIHGVSEGKIKKYGKEFLELIKKYVEEEEIIRPSDIVVVNPEPKRSKQKIEIIRKIDAKKDFDVICDLLDISCDELLNEIEAIINSGVKLNIDYYIDKMIEPERQDIIWDYFDEAETDSIDEAVRILNETEDDEFTEEEIRLMRIKYIAEKGH